MVRNHATNAPRNDLVNAIISHNYGAIWDDIVLAKLVLATVENKVTRIWQMMENSQAHSQNVPSSLDLLRIIQLQSEKLDLLLEKARTDGGSSAKGFESGERNQVDRTSTIADHFSEDERRIGFRSGALVFTSDPGARLPKPSLPLFCGPTNPSFCINVAGMSLNETEGTSVDATSAGGREILSILDGEIVVDRDSEVVEGSPIGLDLPLHPLQDLDAERAIQLVQLYDDLVGVIHPIRNANDLIRKIRELYTTLATSFAGPEAHTLRMDRSDINIIKMVLAIALVMEGKGQSDMATKLYESLQGDVQSKMWSPAPELDDIYLLILVSLYHFTKGDWRLSRRVASSIACMVLEFGLHRRKVVFRAFEDPGEREKAINAFWTIFVLDRQLNCALGLPKAIQDEDVDSSLPLPANAPYLEAMVEYCRLGTRICDSLSDALSGKPHAVAEWQDSLGFFRYRVDQWQKKHIPEELQFVYEDLEARRIRHIRMVLYLRANHLRLLMMRPVLCSPNLPLAGDAQMWSTAVNIACDTLQILVDLDATTVIYQLQPIQYNYFLMTALGVLLLVLAEKSSSHPSKARMNARLENSTFDKARESLLAALNLLQSAAGFSSASTRQSLRASSLCFRLGLLSTGSPAKPISTSSDAAFAFQSREMPDVDGDYPDFTFPEFEPGSAWVDLDSSLLHDIWSQIGQSGSAHVD
ncbi:hypothetical protein NA57DRAFT_72111 [Rhizodiscina lignyota]|uniref:Xylanolytic transcriptional activator regulatory domain-containing protein n=1 Tax=Rhizodiscina lignyota TaxID=1504668 RepID=A0A9P4INE8_9PEZI|nr:hypothetical protein NA57DRAFT_72111 [Rhizodiscina lignyota]